MNLSDFSVTWAYTRGAYIRVVLVCGDSGGLIHGGRGLYTGGGLYLEFFGIITISSIHFSFSTDLAYF